MNPFARFAYFTVVRDTSFVMLATGIMMLAFSFELPLAFKIGATVALIYSLALLARVCWLTEERFTRCEAWRILRDEERPSGERGLRWAHAELEALLLRFAKSSAGAASILYGSALVLSAA
jgi:hypothetical protein